MTALVAIFDNAWTMQQAIERLVARGYDEAVYDEAIISENTGEIFLWPKGQPDPENRIYLRSPTETKSSVPSRLAWATTDSLTR